MTDTKTLTPLGRVLCLALLGGAAAALSGCADGPGNGGTTGGGNCPDGSNDCTNPPPVQCPSGQTFSLIPVGDAVVSKVDSIGVCVGCSVVDAIDVVDTFTNNFAIMTVSVGALAGGNSLTVRDTARTYPAGTLAGFVVSIPDAPVLTLDLLRNVQVTTINNGADTPDSAGRTTPLDLDILGILNNPSQVFISAGTSTVPFNAARLNLGGVVDALTQLRVFGAGICQ